MSRSSPLDPVWGIILLLLLVAILLMFRGVH